MNKKMKRLSLIFSVALMLSVIVGTQFVLPVSAKKPIVTYYSDYEFTQILGTLDGADFEILIPDNWNGMLVVGCRGYSHDMPPSPESSYMHENGMYFMTETVPPSSRFAFAFSMYGEAGYCVQKGMIRTHQLTEYVINNYNVQGKVFLMGFSMGGMIACMLGEGYPNLYSGVLDVCGTKDQIVNYEYKRTITGLTIAEIKEFLGIPPFFPDEPIIQLQNYCSISSADIEIECGGTPESKPKAYERTSPVYNAEMQIPVIIVHGVFDKMVPMSQSIDYKQAVNDATEPDLCRLYPKGGVPPNEGGHCTPDVVGYGLAKFHELVAWSDTL